MRSARVTLAAHVAIAALIFACSSSSPAPAQPDGSAAPDGAAPDGTSEPADAAPQDTGASCALPGEYGSAECMACMRSRCCDAITACEADVTCKDLQRCVLGCVPKPDAGGCLRDCLAEYPSGQELWNQVDHCWFGEPPDGCLVECT